MTRAHRDRARELARRLCPDDSRERARLRRLFLAAPPAMVVGALRALRGAPSWLVAPASSFRSRLREASLVHPIVCSARRRRRAFP